MQHVKKCQKCGHEYVPESEAAVPHDHPCDSCGAELHETTTRPGDEDTSNDEHPIEKGLRKLTDEITGDKHKL